MTILWCAVERDPSFRPPLSYVCSRRLLPKSGSLSWPRNALIPLAARHLLINKAKAHRRSGFSRDWIMEASLYFSPIPGSPNQNSHCLRPRRFFHSKHD